MNRILFVVAAVLGFASPSALADDNQQRDFIEIVSTVSESRFVAGREVRVEADLADDLVAAAAFVTLVNTRAQDVFVAAGRVSMSASALQDMILAGGTVELTGVTADDVYVAGGTVDLSVEIGDDLVAAGGSVRTFPAARVGGVARIAGGDIGIEGKFARELYLAGGAVRIDAEIAGDVEAWSDAITIGPTARIGGTLRYAGRNPPQVAVGAIVTGGIEPLPGRAPRLGVDPGKIVAGFIFAALALTLGLALVLAILQGIAPTFIYAATTDLDERPWENLGIGVAVAILTPPVAILLAVTLIGLPLAILIGLVYVVGLAVALAVISCWIGLWGRERLTGSVSEPSAAWKRILWTFGGFVVVALVGVVPFVGWAVAMLALAAALGAVLGRVRIAVRRRAPTMADFQ